MCCARGIGCSSGGGWSRIEVGGEGGEVGARGQFMRPAAGGECAPCSCSAHALVMTRRVCAVPGDEGSASHRGVPQNTSLSGCGNGRYACNGRTDSVDVRDRVVVRGGGRA